ncbi:hypothetical protein B484DRAFT_407365 [Ochromonadaceae sp. CCMP2298]|nr:hypothetical protein B484DRAFT_407365 [Ochromonadaceae sp. CCMP2298]
MIESATRNYQPSGPTLPSRPISGPPPCKEVPPAADAAEEPAAYSPPLGSHRTTGDFGDFGGAGERSEKDSIVSSAGVANANQGTLKKHKSLTFQQETKSAAEKLFEGFSTNHGSEGSGEGSQANSRVAGSLGDEFDESIDVARISHLSRRTYSFQQNAAAQYMKAPRIALRGHLLSVTALAVLRVADDKNTWILSGSEDKTLKVWSLVTGELVATLTGHVQKVSAIVSCYGEGMRPIAITASW